MEILSAVRIANYQLLFLLSLALTMPDSNNYALDVVGILHRLLVCKIAAHKHPVQSVDSSERMSAVYVQIVSFLVGFFKIRLQRYK